MVRKWLRVSVFTLVLLGGLTGWGRELAEDFRKPPEAARPWVYWFFMDGNLSREGITADLEAMKQAGIGGVIIMEVDVGIPRGPVKFMSEPWRALFKHAVDRGASGWAWRSRSTPGPAGPAAAARGSSRSSPCSTWWPATTQVTGRRDFDAVLPRPQPRPPFFGDGRAAGVAKALERVLPRRGRAGVSRRPRARTASPTSTRRRSTSARRIRRSRA